jgi:hypothetical protein
VAKSDKRAKFGANPQPEKKARFQDPAIDNELPLAWRFSGGDRGGPFAWQIGTDQKFREVIEKLCEFEGKNWNEITGGGSHTIAVRKLCDQAQERLVEIQMDDLDDLMSLRLSGENRVWCIKSGHIMRVLWWDEEHQVYPVLKDREDRKKIRNRK